MLPPALLEDDHPPVAVHRLDDRCRAGSEHPEELVEHLPVAVLSAVADRAEETEDGVEALPGEGQLSEIGLDEARRLRAAGAAAALLLLERRPVDARDAEARLNQGDRAPSEAAWSVQDLGRWFDPG